MTSGASAKQAGGKPSRSTLATVGLHTFWPLSLSSEIDRVEMAFSVDVDLFSRVDALENAISTINLAGEAQGLGSV